MVSVADQALLESTAPVMEPIPVVQMLQEELMDSTQFLQMGRIINCLPSVQILEINNHVESVMMQPV